MEINNNNTSIYFQSSSYLSDFKGSYVTNTKYPSISGTGISNSSLLKCVLCAMGEYLERENMLTNDKRSSFYNTFGATGYSIVQKKVVKVNPERIITLSDKDNFCDSCGQASFSDSYHCVKNALCEFIERQSFIFSYLSKSHGAQIIMPAESSLTNYINNLNDVKFYNISLIDGFYVILCTASYNNNFLIGAGSSSDIDDALRDAVREIAACKKIYTLNSSRHDKKKESYDYSTIFLSIPSEKLKSAYKYLDNPNDYIYYENLKSYKFSAYDLCRRLYDKYKIDPIIVYISTVRRIDNLKVAKIIDLNWFPGLCPKFYSAETYEFIENITHKHLDRKCNFIPFP